MPEPTKPDAPGQHGIVIDRADYPGHLIFVLTNLTMANARCESSCRFALLHHGTFLEEEVHRALVDMLPLADEWRALGRVEAEKHKRKENHMKAMSAVQLPDDVPMDLRGILDYCQRTRQMRNVILQEMRFDGTLLGEEESRTIWADLKT